MKYTFEERLNIGREIYNHELAINEAAFKYEINNYTARDYMRLYKDKNQLISMNEVKPINPNKVAEKKRLEFINYDELSRLSKDELIDEILKARIDAERAKKGYTVKGDGQEKEFINLNNANSK